MNNEGDSDRDSKSLKRPIKRVNNECEEILSFL